MRRPLPLSKAFSAPITLLLSLASAVVTLAWWTGTSIDWAFMNPDALTREPWRLFTSALPHLDILHLVFNLYWLWVLGTAIEAVIGHLRFLLLVTLLAAGSSLAEFTFSEWGVGLSGVGYGLFGLLWALRGDPRYQGAVGSRTAALFTFWFFLCVALTLADVWHVGNVAHASGAAIGYLVGRTIGASMTRRPWWVVGCVATIALLMAGALSYPRFNLGLSPADKLAAQGYKALASNRNDEAARLLEKAVRLDPSNAQTWANLGLARLRREQWEESLAAFEQAYQLDPTVDPARDGAASAAVQIAYLSLQSQQFAQGEAALRRAVMNYPHSAQAWLYLGYTLHYQSRFPEATDAYERALELEPSNAQAWNGLGLAHLSGEQWEESLTALERAYRLDPTITTVHEGAASAAVQIAYKLLQNQQFAEGERVLQRAMIIESQSAEVWLYLGYVLHHQERFPEAEDAYERALELDPSLTAARESLEAFRLEPAPRSPD